MNGGGDDDADTEHHEADEDSRGHIVFLKDLDAEFAGRRLVNDEEGDDVNHDAEGGIDDGVKEVIEAEFHSLLFPPEVSGMTSVVGAVGSWVITNGFGDSIHLVVRGERGVTGDAGDGESAGDQHAVGHIKFAHSSSSLLELEDVLPLVSLSAHRLLSNAMARMLVQMGGISSRNMPRK